MRGIYLIIILISTVIASDIGSDKQWIKLDESTHNRIRPMKITFYLVLKQDKNGINKLEHLLLDHISNINSYKYGQYLSIDKINQLISKSEKEFNPVWIWLNNYNIRNCQFNRDSIKCSDYIYKIEDLFNIKMHLYHNTITNTLRFRAEESYKIPFDLLDLIDFVDGISNPLPESTVGRINIQTIPKDVSSKNNVDTGMFALEVMQRLYNMHDTYTDRDVSIGAIEYGLNGFSNKHLLRSELANGVESNLITEDHIVGENFFDPDMESELDVQVMFWGAPNATLWYEDYNGWIYGWANDFFNRKEVPEVVSISYGLNEVDQCSSSTCNNITSKQYVNRCNVELMKIALRGITIVVAAGDSGSPSESNSNCTSELGPNGWNHINPIFPGSSPWVLSVGSTYIVAGNQDFKYETPICTQYINHNLVCANGTSEIGVYFNKTKWTTGGGFSLWGRMPSWQEGNVITYMDQVNKLPDPKYYNRNGRAYPDVSAVGHNCIMNTVLYYNSDWWVYVDGTSCSAPVFAGIITQLNYLRKQNGKPILGLFTPLLYKMHTEHPDIFNDIKEGVTYCTQNKCCNKEFGFEASKGWDPVSGLGTPNVGKMKEYLINH